jgi:hypothetical protein
VSQSNFHFFIYMSTGHLKITVYCAWHAMYLLVTLLLPALIKIDSYTLFCTINLESVYRNVFYRQPKVHYFENGTNYSHNVGWRASVVMYFNASFTLILKSFWCVSIKNNVFCENFCTVFILSTCTGTIVEDVDFDCSR